MRFRARLLRAPTLALILLSITATNAAAQRTANPYDREQERLARQVERRGNRPEAINDLLELWRYWDEVSPGTTERALDRIGRNRRVTPATRVYARILRAYLALHDGDVGGASQRFDELGFVRRWRVIGPFDNEGRAGYERAYPPEANLETATDPSAEYPGKERAVSWRPYPDTIRFGYVDFDAILRPTVNVCAYAETFVESDRAKPVSVWAGAGGAVKVWWNGEQIIADEGMRNPDPDRHVALVAAREGWNRVLVKACATDRRWGFYLRLGDPNGMEPEGLTADPEGAETASAAPARAVRLGRPPVAPLAALEAAVEAKPEDAKAAFELARYLRTTGSDDPTVNKARQLAERAADASATVDHLMLAAELAENRAERLRFVQQAEAEFPNEMRVKLARADMMLSGPDPEQALQVLDQIPDSTMEGVEGLMVRADVLRDLGLPLAALAIVNRIQERAPGAPRWLRARASAVGGLGRVEQQLELTKEVVAAVYNDFAARRRLISDALEREETEAVVAHLDAMREVDPGDPGVIHYVADVYEGLGREDEALALHQEAIALVPQEADLYVAYAQALLRQGQSGAAAEPLRHALALRPQDAGTRRLLERIEPTERPDEAYATPVDEILARRRQQSDWPVTTLHDLTVNTVYENGLSSSFRQVAFQVHDQEGARSSDSYPVRFEPGRQWVEIRSAKIYRADGTVVESVRTQERSLTDPRYRIYYDTRALVLLLPDLEPGDTVELRYRVEDVSRRNEFNDYYGDLTILQGFHPVDRFEYVLLSPTSREIYFNEPALDGLQHDRSAEGSQRVDRFVVSDVPALRREQQMPGMTEVAPYLHVSTYQTWEEMGRWWWGLAAEQLRPDDALRETVQELVKGAPDNATKVARIYDWVLKNTRYVGLEFGIHGFKPYRVTQVVQRGFGDCKDKASLLYVMMTLAGIDARIALVRTRRNGHLGEEPASLAAFDHAIAYVPELDLFLDGTSETAGTRELPGGDQGVMTLVVGPESAALRTTPVLEPSEQKRARELDVELRDDGGAELTVRENIQGPAAARYRTTYEAQGTREERLQRELSGMFPGVSIDEHEFSTLTNLEQPVTYSWSGEVPQLAQRSGDQLLLAPSTLSGLQRALATTADRIHPLDLGTTSAYEERRVVRLPRGMAVTELPDGGEASSPYGRLSVEYTQASGRVETRTKFEIHKDRVPASEYPAFRRWVEEADALLRQRITLGGAS